MSLPRRGFLSFLAAIPAAVAAVPKSLFASAPKPKSTLIEIPTQVTITDYRAMTVTSGYCQVGPNTYVGYSTSTSSSGSIGVYSNSGSYSPMGTLYIDPDSKKIGFRYSGTWGSARYEMDLDFIEAHKNDLLGASHPLTMVMSDEVRKVPVVVRSVYQNLQIVMFWESGYPTDISVPRADLDKLINRYRNRY